MAINHVDGTLFSSVLIYPVVAAYAALDAGARWTVPLYCVAGLAFGVVVVIASRFAFYSTMGRILKSRMMHDENSSAALMLGTPLMLAYFVFPVAIASAGLFMTYEASAWVTIALTFP